MIFPSTVLAFLERFLVRGRRFDLTSFIMTPASDSLSSSPPSFLKTLGVVTHATLVDSSRVWMNVQSSYNNSCYFDKLL